MSERDMLPADVAELLTAVVDALDIPLPAVEDADERKHYRLLDRRTMDVRIALQAVLRHRSHPDLREDAAYIRRWTAEYPVTYMPFRSDRTEGEG
ncbi:hypothetical protein EDD98_1392 [Streptomyces sp. PanSC19]|uniref:hypothetical protein n=1 Tax=Streptomyces sp. PanSC19 TaxID=1520455 RepID=UPI000FA3FEEA|nr:hypothetical protein [Streptomyces sp. PanSC19]ROQ32408.1 hypothetical protein EDD98_1392 [Streptomyces sp. PanSC19]